MAISVKAGLMRSHVYAHSNVALSLEEAFVVFEMG